MGVSDKLKAFRELQGLNRAQLGEKLGFSREQISAWEAGKYKPGEENLLRLANHFGVKVSDFYSDAPADNLTPVGKESAKAGSLIPFYDALAMGGNTLLADQVAVDAPSELIEPGTWFHKASGAVRIYGHSMFPKYPSGCIVAFKITNTRVIIWGEDYLIELEDRRILKRVEKGDEKGYIKAVSYNINKDQKYVYDPIDIPLTEIKRLYMVLGKVELEASV